MYIDEKIEKFKYKIVSGNRQKTGASRRYAMLKKR